MRRKILFSLVLFAIACMFGSSFVASAQNFQYVLGTDFYAPADMAMPQKGVPFADPDFHTSIVRVTDKTDGYTGPGIQNEYSKTDPENCDGTLVILRGNNGDWYLYNTRTFEMIKILGSSFVDEIEPEPRWDKTNPNVFYYVYQAELRSYNIDSDTSVVVHNFKLDYPSAAFITTGSEGNPSIDQRYWAFMIQDSDYNLVSTVVYDRQTDAVVGHRQVFPDKVEDISMDISGNHCMVGFDSHLFQICSRDFSEVKDMPDGANGGHNDFALTADGRDVLVYQNNQNDYICMTDLDTIAETRLLEIPFGVNSDIGLHISGNSADKRGWVLVSTYGAKQAPPDQTHSWMDTQLFVLQLQENPTVWRIAHTQAYQSLEYEGEKNYFAEAFATINTAGTRVYFGSNWGDFTVLDYTDTYQVTLPSGWTGAASEHPSPTNTIPTATSPLTTVEQIEQTVSLQLEYFFVFVAVAVAVVAGVMIVFLKRRRITEKK